MHRYYQGQLDFFCALYAIINAMTALFNLNLMQARALFATALNDISQHPELWHATLENKTDFHWLVAYLLDGASRGPSYPLRVHRPFAEEKGIPESASNLACAKLFTHTGTPETFLSPREAGVFWQTMQKWLMPASSPPPSGSVRHAAILRFHRYIPYMREPAISHWTVADHFYDDKIRLRDASMEERSLHSLGRSVTALHPDLVSERRDVRIEPESVFFIEKL